QAEREAGGSKIMLYAGNIGYGQALHTVIPRMAKRLEREWTLWVVGDGSARRDLEEAVGKAQVSNVVLRPPVPRGELAELYGRADCLFLHLNNKPAFHRVLPSKVFEYAATGKPIVAGVPGYAAEFVNAEIANAAVFAPHDAD